MDESEKIDEILNSDLAEDVTDIINDYCEENEVCWDEIDFAALGKIFAGTWVEDYKNEIKEW
jgi:capsid protein